MTFPAARRFRRRAYTMLEVILAMAIGLVLFSALYASLGVFQRGSTSGRNLLDQSNIARGVIDQLNTDIAAHLGTTDPQLTVQPTSSSTTGGTTGTSGTSGTTGTSGTKTTGTTTTSSGKTTTTTATKTTSDGDADDKTTTTTKTTGTTSTTGTSKTGTTGTSSSASSSGTSGSTTSVLGPFTFNLGVQGTDTTLVLYVSRVPRELQLGAGGAGGMAGTSGTGATSTDPAAPFVADLRRVSYWLAGGTDAPMGLARQEIKVPTSDDQLGSQPWPDTGNELPFVIAPQVKGLSFEYWDGSTWQTSWDGTALGSDNQTPIGPPLAIRLTLTVAGTSTSTGATAQDRTYQHVVAIPTANNPNPPTTSSTSPSGSSSTTTGGS